MEISKEKELQCAIHYLQDAKGYKIYEKDFYGMLVVEDPEEDTIEFVRVSSHDDTTGFGEEDKLLRHSFEQLILDWANKDSNDDKAIDKSYIFSTIVIIVGENNRAFLRYHRNATELLED